MSANLETQKHSNNNNNNNLETGGQLQASVNVIPETGNHSFKVGISFDKNSRCRRTMEDAHTFVYDFGGIKDQAFFGIYDGHAGKAAADYCGENLHNILNELLLTHPDKPIPEIFNDTFTLTDKHMSEKKMYAGCTVVAALMRWEEVKDERDGNLSKRRLYVANAGDARAVLCRDDKAIRLTYDHKGSDPQESQRILQAGGFMMNNRVNGVLAVTRSLGDSSMKEFVVGNPYTAALDIESKDKFLIIACDGLWDVCSDQDAVNLINDIEDPQEASKKLLDYALNNFSTDNLSMMVVRLKHD
ncbi:protein phosphatase 2C [Conidiobolus coronatus NRRL 28638]|uniref:Protein phosphatase 2C n=1 Tax=Conidiobolus coronatus (strain ATCC 28846 / CBS 209.66 / NRRL 28638) TaxID=796925 RepID=A0A137NX96_CONC2|nr:protein phosphatase 2C [Conidiobolus coronatus NRRL 28638]|eukprot:KXN67321.1 protein phosphatase 2C [Conidiobolus coronatus NRRL 28638]